jgi:putative copper export protein
VTTSTTAPTTTTTSIAPAPQEVQGAAALGIAPGRLFSFAPARLAGLEALVRMVDYTALAILVGGLVFVAVLWPEGAGLGRTRRLLVGALVVSFVATAYTLGLKGASLRGLAALDAFRPSVATGVLGTHVARALLARLGFLLLAVPVVSVLVLWPSQALRSIWWRGAGAVAAAGTLFTHCLTGHASTQGPATAAVDFVHLTGAALWLGGLVVLAVVLLPRRRADEVRAVVPRFSKLALGSVSTMVVAGSTMLVLLSPRWGGLLTSGYGRALFFKLGFVSLLLAAAWRARTFTQRHFVRSSGTGTGVVSLQPLLFAVGIELALAVAVLSFTAVLVGRPPPT